MDNKNNIKQSSDDVIPPFYDLISPRQAELWLSRNHNHRSLNEALVSEYERKMRCGEWKERGGVPVMITADNELINGQHRLTALIRVGRSRILKIQIRERFKN